MDETDPRINAREAALGVGLLSTLLLGLVGVVVFKIVSDRPEKIPAAKLRFAAEGPRRPGESKPDRSESPAASRLQWAATREPERPQGETAPEPQSATASEGGGRASQAAYYDAETPSVGNPVEAAPAADAPPEQGEIKTRMPKFVAPAEE